MALFNDQPQPPATKDRDEIQTSTFGHMVMPNYAPSLAPGIPIVRGTPPGPAIEDPAIAAMFAARRGNMPGVLKVPNVRGGTSEFLRQAYGNAVGVKVNSLKSNGNIDQNGQPIYDVNYTVFTSTGREIKYSESFSQSGNNLNINPSILTGQEPLDPENNAATTPTGKSIEDPQWDIEVKKAIASGVSPATAKAMVNYARSLGIPVENVQAMGFRPNEAGTGTEYAGPGLGTALAKVWERNPTAAKQILAGEQIVFPTDAAVTVTPPEQQGPTDLEKWLMQQVENLLKGGGSGRAKPIYQPPDRREVEDMVRGMLARTKGQPVETEVQTLTDLYMREDRRAFNNPSSGVSAKASVLERIRGGSDYKRIHQLRPDFVDEMDWINPRYQAAQAAGLTDNAAVNYAVGAATVGATEEQAFTGAGYEQLANTGTANTSMRDKFINIGKAMAGGLR